MSLKNDVQSVSNDRRLVQSERPRNKKPPPKTGIKVTNGDDTGEGGSSNLGSKHDTPIGSQSGSPLMFNVNNSSGSPKGGLNGSSPSADSIKGGSVKGNNSPAGSMKGIILGNKDSPSGSRSDSPLVVIGGGPGGSAMSLKNDVQSVSNDPRLVQSERPRNKKPPPKTGLQKVANASNSGDDAERGGSPLLFNVSNSPTGSIKGGSVKGNSPVGSIQGGGPGGIPSPTGSIRSHQGINKGMESPLGGSQHLDPSPPGSKGASRPSSRAESHTNSIRQIEHSSSGVGTPTGSVRIGKSTPPSSRESSRRRASEKRSESPIFYPTTPHEKESSKGGSLGGSRAVSPIPSIVSFEEATSQNQQPSSETWTTATTVSGGGNYAVVIQSIVEEDIHIEGTTQEQDFNATDREDILMVSISEQEVVEPSENQEENTNERCESFVDEIPPPTGEEEGMATVMKSNKVLLQPMTSSSSSAIIDEQDDQPRWKKRSKRTGGLLDRITTSAKNGANMVDIAQLELDEWPQELLIVSRVKSIIAFMNKMTVMPSLQDFMFLEHLDLSRNELKSVDGIEFIHLHKLKHLDLSRNQLISLPKDLTKGCVLLEKLVLHRNQLTTLPADMNNLRQLKYLDASFNQIQNIGNALEALTNLEELNLENNEALEQNGNLIGPRARRLYEKRSYYANKPARRVLVLRAINVQKNVIKREHDLLIAEQELLRKEREVSFLSMDNV